MIYKFGLIIYIAYVFFALQHEINAVGIDKNDNSMVSYSRFHSLALWFLF